MKDFECYGTGLIHASICTSLPIEDALVRMNAENPSGTTHGWVKSSNETFATGAANPCPCHDAPDTHKHWLLEC